MKLVGNPARALLVAWSIVLPSAAPAAIHTVGPGESISATLQRVDPGDIVRLTGTEYHENLVIEVPITLVGIGMPVIRGGYQGNVVHILAPGTRIQGVHVSEMRNPEAPRVAIIEHPDIRRMLLMMKAFTEGMRALLYTTAFFADLAECSEDEAERNKYHGFVELLTPVCKAWPSDMGFRVTEWAMQCYGGYGYCADYPAEQYMRDIKITSIYEGTNGIQAMDLLGRKVSMGGGKLFMNFLALLGEFIEKHKSHATLGDCVGRLEKAKDTLAHVTIDFAKTGASGDMVYPVLNACCYLEMFGDVMVAYLLLGEAVIAREKFDAICGEKNADTEEARKSLCEEDDEARFYWGKLCSAEFFTTQILPRVNARAESIESGSRSALEVVF